MKTIHPTTVREIFLRLQTANPNPTTELVYHSSFELLISVILSAQATDISVNKATAKLYAVANTPETILALGLDGLKTYIKTIGLYNTKAVNILKTCDMLINQHQGQVPPDRSALESLAGVGRKTANVVNKSARCCGTTVYKNSIITFYNRKGFFRTNKMHGKYL